MLVILSPSKTSDPAPIKFHRATFVIFPKETAKLISILKKKSIGEVMALMNISEKLAEKTYKTFQEISTGNDDDKIKAAIFTFKGEVYVGLDAENMSVDDLNFAQDHLRILSGLYGSLKPFDEIHEYRLEMGTRLLTSKGTNLYHFWGDKITKSIHKDIQLSGSNYLVNLASDEYFKSLKPALLKTKVISADFFDIKNGKRVFNSFNAKKARGMLAQYIIKNRINEPHPLSSFDMDGYVFDKSSSNDSLLTFIRK